MDYAIRYGTMTDRTALAKAARTTWLRRGYYGLSFFTRPGLSPLDIAREIAPMTRITKGKLRAARVAELIAAGFEIADERDDGHFNLRFPGDPDDATWSLLDGLMADPEDFAFGAEEGTRQ